MKLKKLPSMRNKKRYIVFRVHSKNRLDFFNVKDALWNSLGNWLGEKDLAKADVHLIKNLWDGKGQIGFLRCSHKFVDEVKVGLGLIHQIGDEHVIFQTLKVAGTIKSGKKSRN